MPVDPRAIIAAHNSADLYAAMFASQGLAYERLPFAFIALDTPPPYYSDLTVQSPAHPAQVMDQIKAATLRFNGRVGIKDSFSQLDLAAFGYEILFTASWIWRDATGSALPPGWVQIGDEAGLDRWEAAWKAAGSPTPHRMFTPALLARTDVSFLTLMRNGAIQAGCIANRSSDCVGLSNVFSASPDVEAFAQAADAAGATAPGLPLVGYESGEALTQAISAGFQTIGDLRILVSRNAKFPD
mgnify:FL=1